ncbi:MAG: DUF4238 domain-containing protein [Solibacillus sp.]
MAETIAKYHHLIPQVYMSAWAQGNGTLKVEFVDNRGVIVQRNKKSISGITNFYSIKAGMPFCKQSDTDLFFASLANYTVEYEGSVLQTTMEMNKNFFHFDNWTITRADGTLISKKKLRHDIEQIRLRDIESNWSSKYESPWKHEVEVIEKAILQCTTDSISAFDLDYLMRFFTALDWRGFSSNAQFEDAINIVMGILEDGEIPEKDRIFPFVKTAWEEIRHYLLLQYYREYLNDSGVIFKDAEANLKHANFHFLVSDGPSLFCTSDTPAFIHKRDDEKLVGLLPITPKILMAKGRCEGKHDVFYITHITDDAVNRYNQIIRDNATEFVIVP